VRKPKTPGKATRPFTVLMLWQSGGRGLVESTTASQLINVTHLLIRSLQIWSRLRVTRKKVKTQAQRKRRPTKTDVL